MREGRCPEADSGASSPTTWTTSTSSTADSNRLSFHNNTNQAIYLPHTVKVLGVEVFDGLINETYLTWLPVHLFEAIERGTNWWGTRLWKLPLSFVKTARTVKWTCVLVRHMMHVCISFGTGREDGWFFVWRLTNLWIFFYRVWVKICMITVPIRNAKENKTWITNLTLNHSQFNLFNGNFDRMKFKLCIYVLEL